LRRPSRLVDQVIEALCDSAHVFTHALDRIEELLLERGHLTRAREFLQHIELIGIECPLGAEDPLIEVGLQSRLAALFLFQDLEALLALADLDQDLGGREQRAAPEQEPKPSDDLVQRHFASLNCKRAAARLAPRPWKLRNGRNATRSEQPVEPHHQLAALARIGSRQPDVKSVRWIEVASPHVEGTSVRKRDLLAHAESRRALPGTTDGRADRG